MMADLVAGAARVLCGCHARWMEPPPSPGPRVYYANHTSHLDAPLIWAALPRAVRRRCRIVAAADYWRAGALRRWLARDCFRAVLIERQRVNRANNPLAGMLAALDAGDALVIFPEGTRQARGGVGTFRGGLWHLARRRPDLPLTPVWLENLSRVLPKGEWLPVPLLTAVTFGPTLHYCSGQTRPEFMTLLRERLLACARTADE
jgi:1-acyl-sn-glycerol-3-phosphate acyltransferase